MANPVLVETVRGGVVENIHRGAISICDASGQQTAHLGDTDRLIFPRSSIKAIQALAMFRSGAVDKFSLTDEEIAIACASHHGEPMHIDVVKRFLDKLGLSESDLECGAHPPSNSVARKALAASGERPTALHNNCSGKHTGMLAVALALGAPTKGYVKPDHPVQKLVKQCIEDVIGETIEAGHCGTDGCSIPTCAAPLKSFASGFSKLQSGQGLTADDALAAKRIISACNSHPLLIAGTDTCDSDLMAAFDGSLMLKIGADGVYCGSLAETGQGFALKCDDGNLKIAQTMVAALVETLTKPSPAQQKVLKTYTHPTLNNWNKMEVGFSRPVDSEFAAFTR